MICNINVEMTSVIKMLFFSVQKQRFLVQIQASTLNNISQNKISNDELDQTVSMGVEYWFEIFFSSLGTSPENLGRRGS